MRKINVFEEMAKRLEDKLWFCRFMSSISNSIFVYWACTDERNVPTYTFMILYS